MRRVAPFDPTQISGCQLWLDANDASTVTGTTTVTNVRDKSTNAYNLVPGSGTTSYANNAITINSSYLYATGAVDLTTFTFFIVAKNIGTSYNQPFFGALPNIAASTFDSTDGFGWYMDNGNSTRFFGRYINNTGQWITTSINTLNIGLYAVTGTSGGVYTQWNNGTLGNTVTSSSRTSTGRGFTVGGEWYGPGSAYYTYTNSGSIYEVVVYNTVLSTAQRQQVEGYLAQKWGLRSNLPGGHPGLTSAIYPTPRIQFLTPMAYTSTLTPRGIAGSSMWLDGADPAGNGTVPSNGSTVSTWVDKSGTGTNLTAVGTPTYTLSNSSVYLNGSSYLQNTNFNFTNYTIFFVSNQVSDGPLYTNNITTSGYSGFFPRHPNGNYYLVQSDTGWLSAGSPFSDGTTYLYSIQYDSLNNINLWSNGSISPVITGTAGTITRNMFLLGKRNWTYMQDNMTGNVFEVVQYNSDLGQTSRQKIEGYLAWKWGLQANLPANHPYKSAAPTLGGNIFNVARPAPLANQYPTPITNAYFVSNVIPSYRIINLNSYTYGSVTSGTFTMNSVLGGGSITFTGSDVFASSSTWGPQQAFDNIRTDYDWATSGNPPFGQFVFPRPVTMTKLFIVPRNQQDNFPATFTLIVDTVTIGTYSNTSVSAAQGLSVSFTGTGFYVQPNLRGTTWRIEFPNGYAWIGEIEFYGYV